MSLRPWLSGFRARLNHQRSRRLTGNRRSRTEQLEQRALLSATALVIGTDLTVLTDAAEDVTVLANATTGNAEVLIDGTVLSAGSTVPASLLTGLTIVTGSANNQINLSGVTAGVFTSLASIDVNSGDGDDVIIGTTDVASTLSGGDGNDSITGGSSAEVILGGDGQDTIDGGDGNDDINAGDGDDSVTAGAGDDTVTGDDGDDTVFGGAGNDSVLANNGADSLFGEAGDDTLNGDGGFDSIDGGTGNDTVFGGADNDTLSGGDGDDLLNGQAGDDIANGDAGNDTALGGGGSDSLNGGTGDDILNGQSGNDNIVGLDGDDSIYGGSGSDELFGDGPDTVSTAFGDDIIRGNSGNDSIIGGSGSDALVGGSGNDLVRSTFEVLASEVAPPPAPPVPPPTNPGTSIFDDAVDSGTGTDVGALAPLNNGPGDGTLDINSVNAFGTFGSFTSPTFFDGTANYDPVGAQVAASTVFNSAVYFRAGATGQREVLETVASGSESTIRSNPTEANSTFTIGSLNFALTQTLEPVFDSIGVQNGTLLTQTYVVTNTSMTSSDFELVRYVDGDLSFDGSIQDGGGRLSLPTGEEILFETDAGGDPATATTFFGITGLGGSTPSNGRFEVEHFSVLQGNIEAGLALSDAFTDFGVSVDTDMDDFVDAGSEYDLALGLLNSFSLATGEIGTYTTHTLYGTGAPNAVAQNSPPIASDDTATAITDTGGTVTFDIVSNDNDSDGALDFSTVTIVTQPANGTAVSLGNGLIEYTANVGFNGVDTFQYTIADNFGAVSAPATVTVTVNTLDNGGDTITGSDGDDTLVGSVNDDFINGNAGDDSISAGGGNDTVLGGSGRDTIDGGAGDDSLDGQGGADSVSGGDGNDEIIFEGDEDGNDTIFGGNGADTVTVNTGVTDDTLAIGQDALGRVMITEGSSTLIVDPSISIVNVNGQAGTDMITVGDLSGVPLSALTVDGGVGPDTIDATGLISGSVRVRLRGGDGNDTITGGVSGDSLFGDAGDDSIDGGAGNDSIQGGDGNDIINTQDGDDTADGEAGNDSITGGAGNDSISGGFDSDTLVGNEGDDTLRGGFGNDNLNGNSGNDSLDGSFGRDSISGGSGNDVADGGGDADLINGQGGNDTIRGDHGDDTLNGQEGNDEIVGGDGDDNIMGGAGRDGLAGNDGDDLIQGQGGADTLRGNDGNDTLRGGGSNDTLIGDQGDDTLDGDSGDDLGVTGEGADTTLDLETIDESFILTPFQLTQIDGI